MFPSSLPTTLSKESLSIRARWARKKFRSFSREMQRPPVNADPMVSALYGAAQPVLGARILLRDPELLKEALVPAAWLAAFCAVCALVSPAEGPIWMGRLKTFYRTFAVLAPVPSIIFAKHYARLAAQVRWKLGFGACGPREYPLFTSARRAVQQAIVIAIGLAPLAIVWHLIPFLGQWISKLVFGAWAVHWVVVDAYDDARVLLPGETVKSAEETDRRAPSPWFVRAFLHGADKIPFRPVAGLLRKFARFCDRLALPWRGEFALMEGQPFISTGFALMTATLLAVPVMNLLFRPIILVASSHLLGHLEAEDPATQHPGMPVAPRALPGR
ncbi:MAG: hypothetical protein ACJ79D_15425 [Myxococcales bacterium]